jgi:hypothetical protein
MARIERCRIRRIVVAIEPIPIEQLAEPVADWHATH